MSFRRSMLTGQSSRRATTRHSLIEAAWTVGPLGSNRGTFIRLLPALNDERRGESERSELLEVP
jgi:hypothetical protein